MATVYAEIGNPGYGGVGVGVSASEQSNNGSTSTIKVEGRYYNDSPYTVYADDSHINLSGRGDRSAPYAVPGNYNEVLDSYTITVSHGSDGSAKSVSFSCYGESTYPSGSATATVTISTSANPRYTVSYDGAGGSTPGSQTKIYGISCTVASASSRTGYTFQYWSGSDGKNYNAKASFTGNYALKLTAVWKINTWTVTFNANGGTGTPSNQTKTYGQTLTITTKKPTRTLYDFVSWSGSDGKTYAAGGSFTGNYNLTLTASWKLAYVKPTIKSLQAYHCLQDGTASESGTYIKVLIGWSVDRYVYSDNQGKGINVTCDGTSKGTINISGISGSSQLIFGGSYDPDITNVVSVYLYDTKQPSMGVSNSVNAQGTSYILDIDTNGNVCFGGAAESTYQICTKKNGVVTWHP